MDVATVNQRFTRETEKWCSSQIGLLRKILGEAIERAPTSRKQGMKQKSMTKGIRSLGCLVHESRSAHACVSRKKDSNLQEKTQETIVLFSVWAERKDTFLFFCRGRIIERRTLVYAAAESTEFSVCKIIGLVTEGDWFCCQLLMGKVKPSIWFLMHQSGG